jgi:glycerol transport system ATP-binding protein
MLEQLPALAPGRYRLGVRAHHVTLARKSPRDVSFPAVVSAQEISGSETLLQASSDSLTLTALLPGVQRHALGTAITLHVEPAHMFVFDAAGKLLSRALAPLPLSVG